MSPTTQSAGGSKAVMHPLESPADRIRALKLLLFAGLLASMAGCSTASKTRADATAVQFMFVQTAENVMIDPTRERITLVNLNPQTLYFSDRPVRVAGHISTDTYLEEWTSSAGADNFASDPPNATLSVYEPGKPDNTLAIVEIFNPLLQGRDLVYHYKLIDGTLPETGGATALFIDAIGPGGGVGVGYHGVGVGRRGPGVR